MPLIVKDFEWEQTDVSVRITVPLKGVQPQKADVFSTDEYLKVSYPPYLFEVFLFAPVEDVKGKAAVGNGVIEFSLVKKEGGIWESLQAPEVGDKAFMKRKREEAIDKAHQRVKEEEKKREEEKREQDRYALRQQMKMDEDERNRVADVKEEERRRATREIERWKEKQSRSDKATIKCLDSDDDDENGDDTNNDGAIDSGVKQKEQNENINYTNQKKEENIEAGNANEVNNRNVVESKTDKTVKKSASQSKATQPARRKKDLYEKPLPEPRATGAIQVKFTQRAFKTAARESKEPEEEEWLKKVAQAGRAKQSAKDNPDAIGDEEMNPLWLKDKGMGFYKSGNYVAAINAFTAAIVLDGSIPSLFSNRAACHLQLKQYRECAQDCSAALELLTPPVSANAASRCKALVRRGTAAFHAEEYVEALKDYESALKIDPTNASVRTDADKIRNIIQGSGT